MRFIQALITLLLTCHGSITTAQPDSNSVFSGGGTVSCGKYLEIRKNETTTAVLIS